MSTQHHFLCHFKRNSVGKDYFDIKECDKLEMTIKLQIKLLVLMNNLSNKWYITFKYDINENRNAYYSNLL